MNDGLSSTQILVTQISGTTAEFTNVSGANVEISAGGISTAELAAAAVTTAKLGSGAVTSNILATGAVLTVALSGGQVTTAILATEAVTVPKQAFVGTGSPSVWGNGIQFGVGTLGAGSTAWIVYGTPFKAAPVFVATSKNDSAINIVGAGSGTNQGLGSVNVLGTTASTTFNWIACGSM